MFKHIIDQSDIFQDTRAYFEESASFFCPLEVLCLALSKVFDLDIELSLFFVIAFVLDEL